MNSAIAQEMDKAIFLGAGSSGEPLGVIAGASTYGITETALDAAVSWSAFRAAVVRFMSANATGSPGAVRLSSFSGSCASTGQQIKSMSSNPMPRKRKRTSMGLS